MKTLNREEIIELFKTLRPAHFKKRGRFLYRKAIPGETVLTIVSGKLETMKTAGDNEVVIRNIELNSSAESYVIQADKFADRYSPGARLHAIDGLVWSECSAKGEVIAAQYEGETLTFTSPWNETMVMSSGDWIARPVGGEETDVYRIERDTFDQTYYTIPSI
jgi:hypothetical protein